MIDVEQHGAVTAIRMARALLGRPLDWSAAYFLDGLLIDTGPACTAHELVRVLDKVNVRQIALTHSHEDNIGGLALLRQRFPEAIVYAARHALPVLEDPSLLHMQTYRRLIWGIPHGVKAVVSLDDVGDRIQTPEYTLRAVETPGHTRDHVSYFEPRHRWLFTGDAFTSGRDIAWAPEYDMFAIVSSMRTLASLHPERVFPSSGIVRRTPLADLHGKISGLIQLATQVKTLDANGYTTADIVQMLFQGEPRLRWWTRGHFSAANLVEACRAYNAIVEPAAVTTAPAVPQQQGGRTGPSKGRPSDPGAARR